MLVHIINASNCTAYAEYLPIMFRQRAEVFVDWLGWKELQVVDGMERDAIDDVPEIEYLLTIDEFGRLVGSSRFVPSTGPHLLDGPLKSFVSREYDRSALTWEWTRYAPTTSRNHPNARAARALMVTAIQEWAIRKGVKRILGISDAANIAFAARVGWRCRALGLPAEYAPEQLATAVEFEVDSEALKRTREFWSLDQAVTFQAPPPMNDAHITKEEVGIWDAVCGLAVHERPQFLRTLSRLGCEDELPSSSESGFLPLPLAH